MLAQRPAHRDARPGAFAYIHTMHILFIGGTRFVGLSMEQDALRRSRTVPDARPGMRRLGDNRNANLLKRACGIGVALRR